MRTLFLPLVPGAARTLGTPFAVWRSFLPLRVPSGTGFLSYPLFTPYLLEEDFFTDPFPKGFVGPKCLWEAIWQGSAWGQRGVQGKPHTREVVGSSPTPPTRVGREKPGTLPGFLLFTPMHWFGPGYAPSRLNAQ